MMTCLLGRAKEKPLRETSQGPQSRRRHFMSFLAACGLFHAKAGAGAGGGARYLFDRVGENC